MTPEVEVQKQVGFYEVWQAWVSADPNQEIESMAFIHTNPPLGFNIKDAAAVNSFIQENAFFKRDLHAAEIEFLDNHTEYGADLRASAKGLDTVNLSSEEPLYIHLNA